MQHNIKITENHPSLIILLLDQSGSMQEPYGGEQEGGCPLLSKADVVARSANMLLMELIDRCCQGSQYRHYYDIAVVGYSGRGVYSLLDDQRWFFSPSELASNVKSINKVLRKVTGVDGTPITYVSCEKRWIEPYSEGVTPMALALDKMCELIYSWESKQRSSDYFLPTVINITDGELTDANEEKVLEVIDRLRGLGSGEDTPTLMNFHISSSGSKGVLFPSSIDELPREAHLLYKLSSQLPDIYNSHVAALKSDTEIEGVSYQGITYNLPQSDFIRAIQIGSTTTQQIYL